QAKPVVEPASTFEAREVAGDVQWPALDHASQLVDVERSPGDSDRLRQGLQVGVEPRVLEGVDQRLAGLGEAFELCGRRPGCRPGLRGGALAARRRVLERLAGVAGCVCGAQGRLNDALVERLGGERRLQRRQGLVVAPFVGETLGCRYFET